MYVIPVSKAPQCLISFAVCPVRTMNNVSQFPPVFTLHAKQFRSTATNIYSLLSENNRQQHEFCSQRVVQKEREAEKAWWMLKQKKVPGHTRTGRDVQEHNIFIIIGFLIVVSCATIRFCLADQRPRRDCSRQKVIFIRQLIEPFSLAEYH